jgi:hypothetical protein
MDKVQKHNSFSRLMVVTALLCVDTVKPFLPLLYLFFSTMCILQHDIGMYFPNFPRDVSVNRFVNDGG